MTTSGATRAGWWSSPSACLRPCTPEPERARGESPSACPALSAPRVSDLLGDHLDRPAGALGGADAAALAEVEVDRVGLARRAGLQDGVVGADAVAVVA